MIELTDELRYQIFRSCIGANDPLYDKYPFGSDCHENAKWSESKRFLMYELRRLISSELYEKIIGKLDLREIIPIDLGFKANEKFKDNVDELFKIVYNFKLDEIAINIEKHFSLDIGCTKLYYAIHREHCKLLRSLMIKENIPGLRIDHYLIVKERQYLLHFGSFSLIDEDNKSPVCDYSTIFNIC